MNMIKAFCGIALTVCMCILITSNELSNFNRILLMVLCAATSIVMLAISFVQDYVDYLEWDDDER